MKHSTRRRLSSKGEVHIKSEEAGSFDLHSCHGDSAQDGDEGRQGAQQAMEPVMRTSIPTTSFDAISDKVAGLPRLSVQSHSSAFSSSYR